MTESSTLFTPTTIGTLVLKNRIAVAPMTRTSASADGLATDDMARYYARFARGGHALVITEGTYPDLLHSQGYLHQPGIANTAQADAWRKVVDAVHAEGSKIVLQLMHAGALSQGTHWEPGTVAPSAVQPLGTQMGFYRGEGPYPLPAEMTLAEIDAVTAAFASAAGRAKQAGFDGVEIHGANGYLLDQFLTAHTNERTDQYGGSTLDRVRLLVEVSQAVRREVGDDFTVGMRISQGKVNDYEHKWAKGEQDAKDIFESLAGAGIDYLHTTEFDAAAPAFGEGESLAALAVRYGRLPVIANGQLGEPDKAEALIERGDAALVTLGKAALANPDWPLRVAGAAPITEFDFALLQPLANIKQSELEQETLAPTP
ncbi:NADH:flavin oxidoreductase [Massilia sp. H6]|uniref:NADH:flavin oxidoreductase n=1 Tax=Massilia sp. H6 TaxID=2970464 RepID=UPI0021695419|nr:NADH:flavin oxidoreductase [Massilia sp. H6]UVW28771.1 NADH:flavin oxidoreductase [Massilia sp. H6]